MSNHKRRLVYAPLIMKFTTVRGATRVFWRCDGVYSVLIDESALGISILCMVFACCGGLVAHDQGDTWNVRQ